MAEAATAAGVTLPLAEAARGWFVEAIAAGRGDDDYSTILAHILGRASG